MNHSIIRALAATVFLCIAPTANAHYLWIAVDRAGAGNGVANIYFEEAPEPGDGSYLDHFLGKSDVWVRTIENPSPDPIEADEVKDGNNRWMRVAASTADEYSVDAYGKFGVYEYGQTKVLLHYYARTLAVQSHDAMHELGRAEQMNLDLVPHDVGSEFEFTLLWKGKPVADRTVFVRGPDKFRKNVQTDSRGKVRLERPTSGRLTLRSSVEFATPGEDQGEAYELVRHNITLVLPATTTAEGP
ncbi:Nickel uptake substrate-specific transmembrane region [Rubripirellula amarantea]|uniref:Nickel uptake substrate-specific transmembrane region n=1 Tax=Rubripirellula amarantea TaxID=2527999 RepID=A0A5C5WLQ2_9BACT|nr:DUF4198 domain-containing protein [Rubripirellula amarantea]TWT50913.1 Nickel uptake substrate-specific transmembrane region [Rubripirellula amarantea]